MKTIDICDLKLFSGNGGSGYISFAQLSGIPLGGNGGNGGSIFIIGDKTKNTLIHISGQGIYRAGNGSNGKDNRSKGKNGNDIYINVPIGTKVITTNKTIEIINDNPLLILEGGSGGDGNYSLWKKKIIGNERKLQSHRRKGEFGKELSINLEIKILADAGFVGKPSAGKSTILSVISNARPKIANYKFTTLKPQLGIVKTNDSSFIVADLPGLIRGASKGKGLGIEFLEHIKKCNIIVHILDFGDDSKNQVEDFMEISKELSLFDKELLNLPILVVANKMDLENSQNNLEKFQLKFPKLNVIQISAIKKIGIAKLKNEISKIINRSHQI